ncbi:MAG TPA: hypothetical protein VD731_00720 [Nitrosopumilaceae archaeon]|nr:hypothetical protein [Nitrosopumilaceae archaeon]
MKTGKISKSLFFLSALFVFGSIGFEQNSSLFLAAGSPLDSYKEYMDEFGVSTARLDMEDNGVIDNSIFALQVENFDSIKNFSPIKKTDSIVIQPSQIPDSASDFIFHWNQDASVSGFEFSSYINEPLKVLFFEQEIKIPDDSASLKLENNYGILLSNEKMQWESKHSYAMLETIKSIPSGKLAASKWVLTDEHIDGDIKITKNNSYQTILVSVDAFENAIPKLASIDGKQGEYYSQRLHHALVRFVTDDGKNTAAIEKILNERYGVSTKVPDYTKLTQFTTNDDATSFQQFHSWELIEIINLFEEMPQGYHKVDGLNYLVRRADGLPHPLYPNAPAVAWPSTSPGYIEFMEIAFTIDESYLHKLIVHEKSHFLWEKLFSNDLKNDWIKIGGWYQDDTVSGWSTTKTTEFVSSYANLINPDEDLAESIAYFITNPDKLKSRALEKYEFIQDRIFPKTTYLSKIREDLTFEVFNLSPDYIYPGKIKRVDIIIKGEAKEDKYATIEIELNSENNLESASGGRLRLFSEIGTFVDVMLHPASGSSGNVLKGDVKISKYAKNGFWNTNQIVIYDKAGNERFEGQNHFGWKFYVNNPLEDITEPRYVKDTLKLTQRVDSTSYQKPIQVLTVSWQVDEDQQMKNCFARIGNEDPQSYSMDAYGNYNDKTTTCSVNFQLTDYHRTGVYSVKFFKMTDMAGNSGVVNFNQLSKGNSIVITTKNPDTQAPFLDLNNISISASPSNPQAPNGETLVNIIYYSSDDKSGLGQVSYTLRDPQGVEHQNYFYHNNFYSVFFEGDPEALNKYKINLILPEGAVPGEWGLSHMTLTDKANNQKTYKFTEIIHFKVG